VINIECSLCDEKPEKIAVLAVKFYRQKKKTIQVCQSCCDKLFLCDGCNLAYKKTSKAPLRYESNQYCKSCYKERVVKCNYCKDISSSDVFILGLRENKTVKVCSLCYTKYKDCNSCGDYFLKEDTTSCQWCGRTRCKDHEEHRCDRDRFNHRGVIDEVTHGTKSGKILKSKRPVGIEIDTTNGDEGSSIPSATLIVASNINSDAVILATETSTIVSDLSVYRSGSAGTLQVFMTGRSTGRMTNALIEASGSRSLLVYTTDISTSDEVIAADMITGPLMDMTAIGPPLGYQNYDWKYDWVVRTYDSAQYKFEIRSSDKLSKLYTSVFSRVYQDQILHTSRLPFRQFNLG
ncbi:hypothetical protein LCGC14_3013730, partial [marine sediment metagenome]